MAPRVIMARQLLRRHMIRTDADAMGAGTSAAPAITPCLAAAITGCPHSSEEQRLQGGDHVTA